MKQEQTEKPLEKTIRQPIVTVCGHVDHGKCITGDTIIPLVDGTLITAKELFEKEFNPRKAKKENKDIIQETDNITLFSNYGAVILPTKVSHIWKREKEELIEIKTAHGDIMKTTPEHPYFKFSIKGDEEIFAENLKIGDYIAIPKQIKIQGLETKKIIFNELKKSDFLCFLNINSKKLIEKIVKAGIKDTEKKLSIKYLDESLRKTRIRVKDLVKIGKYFQISEEELYDMIGTIKNSTGKQRAGHTSKIIKLPDLHEPEKLGYLLGCIAGDGHLSKTQVLLDNNDKEIQEKYAEYLQGIFNIGSFVKQNHTCQTVVNRGGLTFKKFLTEIIGFPDKQKSALIEVPKIAQTNQEIFRGFFAGLIDTDGYVSHLNYSIELTSKSKKIIRQCSILLLNQGIQSVIFEKNGFYTLRIANKKYLDRFLENFRPRLKRKLERIINASKKAQSSRIFDILPIPREELKKLNLTKRINKSVPFFNKYMKNQNLTEAFLLKVLKNVKEENSTSFMIKMLLEKDTGYVKVISKRKIKNKEKYVYDFTVPETHNFVAERTIVHNTSLLDKLRKSSVHKGEAGGITQKISFTLYPAENMKAACPLIDKTGINLKIPGFLLIDTPGHAAFTNLRKRGGSLADLAVLVIDINEGIKPQTSEVIQLLKHNKTPFIIALNKVDKINGWKFEEGSEKSLKENVESQALRTSHDFNEKYLTLLGSLQNYGLDADLYYNIDDFTKKVALVPCSAKIGQGIPELILVLCGLSQKYLTNKLSLGKEGKGIVLEIKKEKDNHYLESIIYDGVLSRKDSIAISNLDGKPIISKIRVLEEIGPVSAKFLPKESVTASTGIRLQLTESVDILPGMPFVVFHDNLEEIRKMFAKEISESIKTDKHGIVVKADSLGSLEALLLMLRQNNIPVLKAGIGSINKTDIINAKANLKINALDSVIAGFNIDIDDEAKEVSGADKIKILTDSIIYKLIENLLAFREEKRKEIEKERLLGLSSLCKLTLLPQYVFRNTSPAIFGVRVEAGKVVSGLNLIDNLGEKVGKIKNIQSESKAVEQASGGTELSISIPGINYERRMKSVNSVYSDISEQQFRNFKKNKDLLSASELRVLQEIAEIKRKQKVDWGI